MTEEERREGGLLPSSIVFPVQLASSIWKLLVVSLVGQALQIMIWLYILVDYVLDLVIRLFLGSICKPCAWIAIWSFKLPTFPIIILGWFFRIMIESMGFLIDGWMLFFGGSGCFLRWGHDCRFARRFKDRSYYQIADLTFWMRNPSDMFVKDPTQSFSESMHSFFGVPKFEDFNTELSKRIGEQRRQQLFDSCPVNKGTISAAKATADEAMAFFGL